jgi:hypothetical protein
MGCLLVLAACYSDDPAELVLCDFESDAELDRFHWKCHTLFSLSDEHVTHGSRSLRLEFYPYDYPGVAPMLEEMDWSRYTFYRNVDRHLLCLPRLEENDWMRYKALCFDIFNPEEKEIRISLSIDDQKIHPKYEGRFNTSFILKPGMNSMRIPLSTLVTSGTRRTLNLRRIYRFLILMTPSQKKVLLYVDYVRLVS